MKRVKQRLAVLLCIAALCVLAPAALAAQPLDESENDGKVIVYFDTCGGTGIPVVERTNADGKLSSLPTPTMEGYTFNGWYTEMVGGSKVSTSTVFAGDTTIYAHWTVKSGTSAGSTAPVQPAAPSIKQHLGTVLVAGILLTTLAAAIAAGM